MPPGGSGCHGALCYPELKVTNNIQEILRRVRVQELDLAEPCCVSPSASLEEVYGLLDEKHPGAVVVCEGGSLRGIFTERDVLYRTALEGLAPSTPISEIMTPVPSSLSPADRVADAIGAMTRGGHRHLPLVEDKDRLVGIVSSRDVLRFIAGHFPESTLNLPPRLHQQLSRPEGG